MTDLLKEILSMSLSGSLIILLVLAMKPVLKNRFSKAWQYYIWIIVLIRLILPFSPEFGIIDNIFRPVSVESSPVSETGTKATAIHTGENNLQGQPAVSSDSANLTIPEPKGQTEPFDGWRTGSYLWLAGMVIIIGLKQIRYLHFLIIMKKSSEPVADKRILLVYKRAAEELEITARPQLKLNGRIASPMLMGLFKPAIYLTDITAEWDEVSLYYVLRHELMHYKRHDLWYKWFSSLVLCVHWFNPLVFILNREINSQCEISCDEAVARDLSKEDKLVYGNVLLNAVAENGRKHFPVLSSTLYEDKKSMKERIKSIIMSKRKSKRTVFLSAFVAIILCAAAFWLGAYTMGGRNTGIDTASAAGGQNTDGTGSNTPSSDNGSPDGNNQNLQNNTTDNQNDGKTVDNSTDSGNGNGNTAAGNETTGNETTENTATGSTTGNTAAGNTAAGNTTTGNTASENTDNSNTASQTTSGSPSAVSEGTLVYSNTDYGFNFTLPGSWKGYSVVEDTWQGTAISGKKAGKVTESGTKLLLRNPKWTKKNPYQDIPIMVFTKEQWKLIEAEELAVSAAPIGPGKLGENSKYVFALPARYNFAYPTGYEEVEKIMESSPLTPAKDFK